MERVAMRSVAHTQGLTMGSTGWLTAMRVYTRIG